jgi:hypothetical protein
LGSGGVSSKVLYNAALESAKQTESQKTSGTDAEET